MKITEILILLVTAIITSVILELNIISSNLEKNINKKNLFYISHALTSSICGILLSLVLMTLNDNIIIWIIGDMIGVFLGKTSFKVVTKFILSFFKFIKETDIDSIIEESETEDNDVKNKDT